MFANRDRIIEARGAALRLEGNLRAEVNTDLWQIEAWRELGLLFGHLNEALTEDKAMGKLGWELCQAAMVRAMGGNMAPLSLAMQADLAKMLDRALEEQKNVETWRLYGSLQRAMDLALPQSAVIVEELEQAGACRNAFVAGEERARTWKAAPPPPPRHDPVHPSFTAEELAEREARAKAPRPALERAEPSSDDGDDL